MASEGLTLDEILYEFQNVRIPWPHLALALKLDNSIVETISQQCGSDEDKALRMVLNTWMSNYESSWEILSLAVMHLPMLRQKGAELYTKYVSQDLTAEAVDGYLCDLVENWFQLGYMFLCNSQKVNEVVSGETESEKRLSIINYWLKSDQHMANWETVARRIEDCLPQHEKIAEEIRKRHVPEVKITPLIKPPSPQPDTELNVSTAYIATQGVEDWYALGKFLKLNEEDLQTILEDQSTRTDEKRMTVLQIWLEDPENGDANWTDLANAVRLMPQHVGKSETIRTKYCKKLSAPSTEIQPAPTEIQPAPLTEIQPAPTEIQPAPTEIQPAPTEIQPAPTEIQPAPLTESTLMQQISEKNELIESQKKMISSMSREMEKLKGKVRQEAMETEQESDAITRLLTHFNNLKVSLGSVETDLLTVKEQLNQPQTQEGGTQTTDINFGSSLDLVPIGLLNSMEIISEYRSSFTSDVEHVINQKEYGFKLYIPKGSIPKNEIGYIKVYAIHSGPFEFDPSMESMSIVYCIALSHELLIPATLEIQHCYDIKCRDDSNGLSFASAAHTGSPPFKFEAIEGGRFSPGNDYATIKRQSFCFLSIVNFISKLLRPPPLKRRRSQDEVEFKGDDKTILEISYVLTASYAASWCASITVVPCLNALHEHHKNLCKRNKRKIIDDKPVLVIDNKLDQTYKTLKIAVTGEDESRSIQPWNGDRITIENWNIRSDQTEITRIYEQSKSMFYPAELNIEWSGNEQDVPKKVVFKVFILGFEDPHRARIHVEIDPKKERNRFSSSQSFSSVDVEELCDPPDLQTLMNLVAPKLSKSWNLLGLNLISESELENVEENSNNSIDACKLLFRKWLKHGKEEATWEKLINALKTPSVGEKTLASKLDTMYNPI